MQVLVVGAGVIGLAVARALALAGHEVIVAEATNAIGTGISSRNSEVIHAGLYYPSGSLRARHCPAGRRALYELAASHGVPHRKCGKLVIAAQADEIARLEAIHAQAVANGVEGVAIISAQEAQKLEPALFCVAAMISPETGVIDSHRFMLALRGDLEDHGGAIAFNTPIERLERPQGEWQARFGGSDPRNRSRSTRSSIAQALGRSASPALPRAIRQSASRASSSPRATISTTADVRHSRA
jgi:L-2-hydroxyglutarate oxidase LhgO